MSSDGDPRIPAKQNSRKEANQDARVPPPSIRSTAARTITLEDRGNSTLTTQTPTTRPGRICDNTKHPVGIFVHSEQSRSVAAHCSSCTCPRGTNKGTHGEQAWSEQEKDFLSLFSSAVVPDARPLVSSQPQALNQTMAVQQYTCREEPPVTPGPDPALDRSPVPPTRRRERPRCRCQVRNTLAQASFAPFTQGLATHATLLAFRAVMEGHITPPSSEVEVEVRQAGFRHVYAGRQLSGYTSSPPRRWAGALWEVGHTSRRKIGPSAVIAVCHPTGV
ncbi:hypothetical protein BV22DRAFT_1045887 [Leucogyrophana mollusca]|uniref:Uncharacterized protein n=1 Tax=Leucogyrophana mollusca TaxID=85980 RepID=A0ACB8BNL2_9AGAM|nr:hypothetical protein BV22DRAFT_1045887 [Leucogyrophana mollusca]